MGVHIELILRRPFWRSLSIVRALPYVLFSIAIFFRIFHALRGPPLSAEIWSDMKIYTDISNEIGDGIWKTTHFFQSIGYPILVSGLRKYFKYSALALTLLQATASCVSLFVLYRLADESLGRKVALFTLALGAVHFPWILYSNFALPEILFTFLLSLCAWLTWKLVSTPRPSLVHAFLWGLFFISAFWLKGTHALWGPLFITGLFFLKKRTALPAIFVICSVITMGLAAHGLLTYQKIGKIQLSASTSGLNFIEGKCPHKRNIDSLGYSWLSPLYYQLGFHNSKTWDRPFTDSGHFMNEGLKCIQKDPFVLIQSVESIPYLFYGNSMWPFSSKPWARYTRLYELFFALFLVVGLTVYALDLFKQKHKGQEIVTWVLPVAAIFLCVYIFKSEMRYRVPYDLWFIPLGVKGWLRLTTEIKEGNLIL